MTDTNISNTTNSQSDSSERLTCVVKWFNSKYGYGFVKDLNSDNDYFAHQSQLQTNVNCYKTLYQGEYIECNVKYDSDNNKKQAVDITGIKRNQLMCEHKVNTNRPSYNYSNNYERQNRDSVNYQ